MGPAIELKQGERAHGMAIEHEEDSESGPTYKLLFLGACVVIGGFIGWWATDVKQSVSRVWERFEKLDSRTTTLEAGAIEHKYQHHHLDQEIDRIKATVESNSKVIREMERTLPRR